MILTVDLWMFLFFCFSSMLCCGCQSRVVVLTGGDGKGGCGMVFLGSGIYYFIVGNILFYCDVYILFYCVES